MAIDLANGTTITFGTSSFTAEILSIESSGTDGADDIETTHLGTSGGYKTYQAGDLREGGEYTITGHFTGQQKSPGTTSETITIAWGGTAYTTAFSGYFKSFERSAPGPNEKMTFSAVLKVAGAPTHTTS